MLLAICLDARNSETNSSATLLSAHKSCSRLANLFLLSFLYKYIPPLLIHLSQIIIFFSSSSPPLIILSSETAYWIVLLSISVPAADVAILHHSVLLMIFFFFFLPCLLLLLSQEMDTKGTIAHISLHIFVSNREVFWPALCCQHLTAAKIWLTAQLCSLSTQCHFLSPSNVLCIGIFFCQCFCFFSKSL